MWWLGIFERLAEITYGEGSCNIKIEEIEIGSGKGLLIGEPMCVMVDLDTIEKYGFAVRSAKVLKERKNFVLTKRGNLFCGQLPNLPIILVKIGIKKNLDFLADMRLKKRFWNGYAIASVEIPMIYPKQESNENLVYDTFELIFKGPPVERE